MEIIKTESNKDKNIYFNSTYIKPNKYSPKLENQVVNIYPDISFQELIGIGGAITESSAYCYSLLSDDKKNSLLDDYFSNINYSLCRLPIGSCDFSLNSYSYSYKHDLSDFSIERDFKYLIPFIKHALSVNPSVKFIASPWSPPKFMKNTKLLILGGKLLEKYKQLYADYIVKYLNSYNNLGIKIEYITVQNEPNAVQVWESCLFSAEDEADFVVNYLYPTFKNNNINTKIIIYDHNKEKLFSRAVQEFSIPGMQEATSGLAFHWYSGNHFENISLCKKIFPDKLLFHTEGCCGFNTENFYAYEYAYDILSDLNAGANGFVDWNILLDSKGGPNHKKNYCNSPVMLNNDNSDYIKHSSFYFIGHFSKYIKPGAVRIGFSKYTNTLEMTAFKNPDSSIVVIMLNRSYENIDFNLCLNDFVFKDCLEGRSIASYLIKN